MTPASTLRPWKGIASRVLGQAGVIIEGDRVRLPYFRPDGSVFRERIVPAQGDPWWSLGEGLLPYGLELLAPASIARTTILLITEGESDTLALREACAEAGSFSVLGLPGARTWKPDWVNYVSAFPAIYVLGDGDPAGTSMNEQVTASVPWALPVQIPDGDDARSLVQRDGFPALATLIDEAAETAHRRAESDSVLRPAGAFPTSDERER